MKSSLVVQAIKFNHDPASHSADALNIRKNATTFVDVPEWVRGETTKPELSPVAYAQKETSGHTITIQASFRILPPLGILPKPAGAYIRAVDALTVPPHKPFPPWPPLKKSNNVLGNAEERWVKFNAAGESGFVSFNLKDVKLWNVGVGIRSTYWLWQARLKKTDPWITFDQTAHRVYILLEAPKAPWQQQPYDAANTQLPWTEVLDYACVWARGAVDVDAAAGKVTENINALGPALITYDCPGWGGTHYTNYSTTFYLTEFLERLGGGVGLGEYVNCTDCATFVATFANILGCDLWEMTLGWGFQLNELIGIGSADFGLVCGSWTAFNFHEVGWKGPCSNDGEVFDACLQVDGDNDPTDGPPHTALLPEKMKHGATGDLLYRDRLAAPPGRPNCNPDCANVRRRTVA